MSGTAASRFDEQYVNGNRKRSVRVKIKRCAEWCLLSMVCLVSFPSCFITPSAAELREAIMAGDLEQVKTYISEGVQINDPKNSEHPLIIALKNSQFEIVSALIDGGADVTIPMDNGLPVYFWFAVHGKDSLLQRAVEKNPHLDLNFRLEDTGESLLHYAAERSSFDSIKLLIDQGANLEFRDKKGRTPLSRVISRRNYPKAKFLIENGADVNYEGYSDADIYIEIAYYWADGYLELAELAYERGATLEPSNYALQAAVMGGNYDYVKWLLDHGADPNARDEHGVLPIDNAFRFAANPEGPQDPEKLKTVMRVMGLLLKYGSRYGE